MTTDSVLSVNVILGFLIICVKAYNSHMQSLTPMQMERPVPVFSLCLINNVWTDCPDFDSDVLSNNLMYDSSSSVRDRILRWLYLLSNYQTSLGMEQYAKRAHNIIPSPNGRGMLNIDRHSRNLLLPHYNGYHQFNTFNIPPIQSGRTDNVQNIRMPIINKKYSAQMEQPQITANTKKSQLRTPIMNKNSPAQMQLSPIQITNKNNPVQIHQLEIPTTDINNPDQILQPQLRTAVNDNNDTECNQTGNAENISMLKHSATTELIVTKIYSTSTQQNLVMESKTGTMAKSIDNNDTTPVTMSSTSFTTLVTTTSTDVEETQSNTDSILYNKFTKSVDKFERKFFELTFNKLSSISHVDRRENGISFLQSGLFLHMVLMAISMEVDPETKAEIDKCIEFEISDAERIKMLKQLVSWLPVSSDDLKFRWTSRLVIGAPNVSQEFLSRVASAMHLKLNYFNGKETPEELTKMLNKLVEIDSGGAMRDTFDEDELSEGVRAVLLSTLYVRGRWRTAPTLLNGTRPFQDADVNPKRSTRMVRINDIMRYTNLPEWDAEALEISYGTPGLTLLLLVPRGRSLRSLVHRVASTNLREVTAQMYSMRVAASLPLYTLRMTLLLPAKLQDMGISRLVDTVNITDDGTFRLSHAVQRLMFWAEAGRHAFKDDGIEWDESPELELVVDRPYVYFVRWHNVTILTGNFVL